MNEYQGLHEGVCACVCACVRVCVMFNKVETLSYYPTPLGSVCHVRLVPASMSCTVCLCRRSQLVTRPGLFPVLPAPAVSGVNIFPSNASHKYVDLPDKVSSALCGVGRVNFHVCGGYCTCVWRQCTCVCLHTCTYVYVLLLYTYLQY